MNQILTRLVNDVQQLYFAERLRTVTELSPVFAIEPYPTWQERALDALSSWGSQMDMCSSVGERYWDLYQRVIRPRTEEDRRGRTALARALAALHSELEDCLWRGKASKARFDAILWPNRKAYYLLVTMNYDGLTYTPAPPPEVPRRRR